MATLTSRLPAPDSLGRELPLLENGDRLDQPTYHALYLNMPEGFRAQLIGGLVFVASPVGLSHMRLCRLADRWLAQYEEATPGTEALANGTVVLGPENEPEPDCILRFLPEYGGQTSESGGYLSGPPELVVEVAVSTAGLDLHLKKLDYERAGVREYVVVLLREREVRWFRLVEGAYVALTPGTDRVLRSEVFPGLWLQPEALLSGNRKLLREVLQQGLASEEHARWLAERAA